MKGWYTVTLIADRGDAESGAIIDSWEHPFESNTAEDAMEMARNYYSVMKEVQVVDARPSTEQEVNDYLDECYGYHEELQF